VTFSPAVIITALISGLGAGLFCVALSAGSASFLLLPPRWSLSIGSSADVLELLVFIVVALFHVILITGMRLSLERRDLSHNLEQRLEERSAALARAERALKRWLEDSSTAHAISLAL
jgi:K+-sensing histidine kinase KdpD